MVDSYSGMRIVVFREYAWLLQDKPTGMCLYWISAQRFHSYGATHLNSFSYFAYGSNMLLERLQQRCPSAQCEGIAIAHGYEIEFSKISKDTSGKATLKNSNDNEAGAYGVLFTLQGDDLTKLDRAEGLGFGYDRINDFSVRRLVDDELIKAKTYLAPPAYLDNGLLPFDWYLNLVVAGAKQNGLPSDYVRDLRAIPSIVDPQPTRGSRAVAIEVLSNAKTRIELKLV